MSAIIACCQNCDYSRECSGTTDYDLLFACARDNYLVHADDWCCHFADSHYREHLARHFRRPSELAEIISKAK